MAAMKMTQELKDKWIAALRGGEYKQGCGSLRSSVNIDGSPEYVYCCLGVLGDLLIKNKLVNAEWCTNLESEQFHWKDVTDGQYHPTGGQYYSSFLPDHLIAELPKERQEYLASRNDEGDDFLQIAALIEEMVQVEE